MDGKNSGRPALQRISEGVFRLALSADLDHYASRCTARGRWLVRERALCVRLLSLDAARASPSLRLHVRGHRELAMAQRSTQLVAGKAVARALRLPQPDARAALR